MNLKLLKLAYDLLFQAEPSAQAKKLPVLVVDDDEPLGELISIYLGELGYECEVKTTLAGARLALEKRQFSHMLLDVSFPQGDGLAFAKEIHNQKRYRSIRIGMLTGVRIWMETAKGLSPPGQEHPRVEIPAGKLLIFIGKGGPEISLKEAVQEFVTVNGHEAAKSRSVFVVSWGYLWLAATLGYGLRAGWWVDAVKAAWSGVFKNLADK